MKYFVEVNGRPHEVDVVERLGELKVSVNGKPLDIQYEEVDRLGQVSLRSGARTFGVSIEGDAHAVTATIAGHLYEARIEDERERAAHAAERERPGGAGAVLSVMPGIVVEISVAPGEVVEKGQPLVILEAMKMQNEIRAPASGTVKSIHVTKGVAVAGGTKLVTLE